jgi:hypothetical protein
VVLGEGVSMVVGDTGGVRMELVSVRRLNTTGTVLLRYRFHR